MNALFGKQPDRFGAQQFVRSFRLLKKQVKASDRVLTSQRRRSVKRYIELDALLVLEASADRVGHHYNFIFHRLPLRLRHLPPACPHDVAGHSLNADSAVEASDSNPDRMLTVRYLGEATANVICASIPIRSAVWLQTQEGRPQFLGDFAGFPGEPFFDPLGAVSPRKVDDVRVFDTRVEGSRACPSNLVETMPRSEEGLIEFPLDFKFRERDTSHILDALLPGLKIRLDGSLVWAQCEVGGRNGLQLNDCFLCNAERFLRSLEQ